MELAQWCKDSGNSFHVFLNLFVGLHVASSSKAVLAEALITQKVPEEMRKRPKNLSSIGTPDLELKEGERPKLEKGITAANVFQWYKM